MKVAKSALAGIAALLPLSAVALRGAGSGGGGGAKTVVEREEGGGGRSLQLPSLQTIAGEFAPLTCNTALDTAVCEPWSFGNTVVGAVEIPCNTCVDMSNFVAGETVTVGGLNVLGRLHFPEGTKVTLRTPHLFVQGKLSMTSTSPVSGEPDVKIEMTGDSDQFLVPESTNAAVCPAGGCNVGPKAVVVAGGQLDIDALADTCPAWSYVNNFSNDGVPQPAAGTFPAAPVPSEGCSLDVVNATFDDPTLGNMGLDGWTGNLGAIERLLSGSHDGTTYMSVEERTEAGQGPLLSLRREPHRRCLEADVEYFFSAKVKLSGSSRYPGHISECSQSGAGCLKLRYSSMGTDDKVRWLVLASMTKASPADGTWFDFVGSFRLRDLDVNATNIFQVFSISGPEKEVDIAIDDIRVGLASASMFPDPNDVCSELIINGGADALPGMTFPFYSWRKNRGMNKLEVLEENGNAFFRVPDRHSNSASVAEVDTIAYTLPAGCLVPGGTYSFSAKYRIDSAEPAMAMGHIRTLNADGSVSHDRFVNSCPPSSSSVGWVTCTGILVWQGSHSDDGNAQSIDLMLTIEDGLGADADFDDISFSFLSGAPTGGLELDPAVTSSCYTTGAKAVIPSDEIRWEVPQEVTVSSVDGPGLVSVNETYGLDIPTTTNESPDFGGQFMFLSRNVEFSGDGGTLTVLGTNAVQKIQGVSIVGFGQAGVEGRNPINFRLVSDATGSVVKKNSITGSTNRCIQVQATNNLYVGENVAYNNQGHCYATQEGSEAGNTFERNIGASVRLGSAFLPADPDAKDESEVAVFFSHAPGNSWIDNVAAGSEMMGFYLRPRINVRGDTADANQFNFPFQTPIVAFSGNVAHSNGFNGVEIMGYNPLSEQVFLNTRSYKNRGVGVNIKASSYVTVDDGVVADSRNGVDVFRSDRVVVRNAEVIGYSLLYKTHADNVDGATRLCSPGGSQSVVGVRFHPNKRTDTPGLSVENVSFSRFGVGSGCDDTPDTSALGVITHGGNDGSFTTTVSTSGLAFEAGSRPQDEIKLCAAEDAGIAGIVVGDLDGSLNPSGTEAGTVVGSAESCAGTVIDMPESCASYCVGGAAPVPAAAPTAPVRTFPVATPDLTAIPQDVTDSACLTNGAFESGQAGWMALPASGASAVSSALTTGYGGTGQAVVIYDRTNQARGGLYQSLSDGSCLTVDSWYEVSADVKLLQSDGSPFECRPEVMWYNNPYSCGFVTLLFGTAEPRVRQEVAALSGPLTGGGWNRYYGAFKAGAEHTATSLLMLMVAGAPAGVDMYVDNVVLKEVPPADYATSVGVVDCASPIVNGDFETGDLTGWFVRGNVGSTDIGTLSVVTGADGTGNAARHENRPADAASNFNAILQKIPTYCFTAGSTWNIAAKFRYFAPNGTAVPCDKNTTQAVDSCPTFMLEAAGEVSSGPLPNTDAADMVVGDWNDIAITYTIPSTMSIAAMLSLKVDTVPEHFGWRDMWFKVGSVHQGYIYEVDDIVMTMA